MMNFDRLYRSAVLGVSGNSTIKNLVHDRAKAAVSRFLWDGMTPDDEVNEAQTTS